MTMTSELRVPQVAEQGRSSPGPRRRWWTYLRPVRDPYPTAMERANAVRADLELTREVLAGGWVQNSWFGGQPPAGPAAEAGTGQGTGAAAACLVGALAVAVKQRLNRPDLTVEGGPAVDVLWDAMHETRGIRGPAVAGRAAPPEVRMNRIRELVRWNDEPGRRREEVVGLVDVAISRVIMTAVQEPVTSGQHR